MSPRRDGRGSPPALFIPQDGRIRAEYERGWKISEIMDQNGDPAPGIVTTHDEFAISWDADEAAEKVRRLLATKSEDAARSLFRLCSQAQWNYDRAKRELAGGAWKKQIRPILYDVFHYIYAVFHSPTFRSRYADFLKLDFPRVPLTSNRRLFRKLCAFGEELVSLHLLEAPILSKHTPRYPNCGDDRMEKGFPKYLPPRSPEPQNGKPLHEGRVYIHDRQDFEGVPPDVWNFHIGGYQVCEKWLKDRRGRVLSQNDLVHYQKIITALSNTLRRMAEIDQALPSWPLE